MAGKIITALSVVAVLIAAAVFAAPPGASKWELPAWVPPPREPAENPTTSAKVELGRHLFYDKRLSANESMACATCHEQARAFTDGKRTAVGSTGEISKRNSMSLINVAYLPTLTWGNPQIESLEVQALIPIFGEHPVEMGMAGKEDLLFTRLKDDPIYRKLFDDAYSPAQNRTFARSSQDRAPLPDKQLFSLSTVTKALAAFQRSLLSFNSPYDRFKYGKEKNAIGDAAKRGEALFFGEKMECYHCHAGLNFTDNIQHAKLAFSEKGFHNTGLYNEDGRGTYPPGHEGIAEFTGREDDMGKFRTPSLRNIALTAPYMHDGSIATLEEVVRTHYAKKGRAVFAGKAANPLRSPLIAGFQVNDSEVRDLVEFLKSLTDESFVKNPRFSNPWVKK